MVALAIACGMVCLVLLAYDKAMQRHDSAIEAKLRHELGQRLDAAGWWFSSHPPTSLAIRTVAQHLLRDLALDPQGLRDDWHKGLKQDNGRAEPT